MSYKTFVEQKTEHVHLLRENGIDVSDLILNTPKWIRCKEIGLQEGRGNFAYISTTQQLSNGLTGLSTSYRGINGSGNYQTYGLAPDATDIPLTNESRIHKFDDNAARKRAYGFWVNSSVEGDSPYLKFKGVGYYGIRFRNTTAIIPLRDVHGNLCSYQMINPDGSKIFMKGSQTKGVLHWVKKPEHDEVFGVAEGYTTAAAVFELTGMPIAACMSVQNLVDVIQELISFFPANLIYIFSDNDRHLEPNIGLVAARKAQAISPTRIQIITPDFVVPPSKAASDFNDLVRLQGKEFARELIEQKMTPYARA